MDYKIEAATFEQRVKGYISSLKRETVTLIVDHYIGSALVNSFVVYNIDKSDQLEANLGIRRIAAGMDHTVDVKVIDNKKSSTDEEPQKG